MENRLNNFEIHISDAIEILKPGATSFRFSKTEIVDWMDNVAPFPTKEEIDAKVSELQVQTEYLTKRRREYPKIGDQLDALFHAGVFPDDMAAKLKKVKDDNPKPKE